MGGLTTTPLDKTSFEDVRESIDQCSRGDLLDASVSHLSLRFVQRNCQNLTERLACVLCRRLNSNFLRILPIGAFSELPNLKVL